MKGIYLGAFKAYHPGHDLVYQDINGQRDLGGDMLQIDLSPYEFIIATPPCNYWSRANYRRETSDYAQLTKHLLPGILNKLVQQNKPFIVENVRNYKMFKKYGLFDIPCFIYFVGRHTYWSNMFVSFANVKQSPKTEIRNGKKVYLSSQNLPRSKRQGGEEVHEVIELWIKNIERIFYGRIN